MGLRLPAEYQEVEYIEGTRGIQYINTGIAGNDDNLVIEAKVKPGSYTQYCPLWGNYVNESSNVTRLIASSPAAILSYINQKAGSGVYTVNCGAIFGTNKIFTIRQSKNSIEIDGISYAIENRATGEENNTPIAINAARTVNPVQENTTQRFYYFRIFSSEVMLIDLVPCYRKSDDEPGMYDFVSGTFFTNAGTGEFIVGPDVVDHISPRLMDRRRVLIAKLTSLFKNIITSQTGLVSFNTNFAKPMKVTCEFSPKQDLHGYDNPWPAGGGKNLFDGSLAQGGISAADGNNLNVSTRIRTDYIPIKSNTVYAVSSGDTVKPFYWAVYDSEKTIPALYIMPCPPTGILDISNVDNAAFLRVSFRTQDDAEITPADLDWAQIEENTQVTSYAPYENICPIEGWDGVNAKQCGKNLFNKNDPNIITGRYFNRNGTTSSNGNYALSYVPINPGDTLVYSGLRGGNGNPCGIQFFDANKTFLAMGNPEVQENNIAVTAPSGAAYIGVSVFYANNESYKDIDTAQLEIGSVATDYEPYHGATLPIPFNNPGTYDFLPVQEGTGDPSPENVRPITPGLTLTRDDNTTLEVYGGSLTVNADGTGTVTSKYYHCVYDGVNKKMNRSYLGDYVAAGDVYCNPNGLTGSYSTAPMCDKLFGKNGYGDYSSRIPYQITSPGSGSLYFVFTLVLTDGSGVTTDAECIDYVNNWLQNNPTSVAYKLLEADYQTYTLSVSETSRAFEALGLGKNLGPLYGGTVTLNEDGSCDVVASLGKIVLDGSQNPSYFPWTKSGDIVSALYPPLTPRNSVSTSGQASKSMCDTLKFLTDIGYSPMQIGRYGFYKGLNNYGIAIALDKNVCGTTKAELNAYLADNPITAVYELMSPVTYHFSSIADFKSFIGSNNVWSDLDGPITVEYYNNKKE